MSEGKLESNDYDRYLSQSEKEERARSIASNDAFILAMARAVRKGHEHATPGIFKDRTPSNARRIYADVATSACGSPSAMCMESGASVGRTK